MPDYKALYFKLFAALADAVEDLEQGQPFRAKQRLICAQQEAEEIYTAEQTKTEPSEEGSANMVT